MSQCHSEWIPYIQQTHQVSTLPLTPLILPPPSPSHYKEMLFGNETQFRKTRSYHKFTTEICKIYLIFILKHKIWLLINKHFSKYPTSCKKTGDCSTKQLYFAKSYIFLEQLEKCIKLKSGSQMKLRRQWTKLQQNNVWTRKRKLSKLS